MRPASAIVTCALSLLAACGGSQTVSPSGDAAPPARDRSTVDVSPTADTDGDGLCDGTERARRTDPALPDTDGDGLLDSFEARLGSDALSGRSPRSDDRVLLREGDPAFVTVEHTTEYEGTGGVLTAVMQDRGEGLDGRLASGLADFAVEAASANPAAFVRDIAGPRFVGVLGRVALRWRITVRPREGAAPDGGGAALGCRRAYEAQLVVKREGDDVVSTRPLLLEVAPPEGAAGRGAWPRVSADGLCLPARCF